MSVNCKTTFWDFINSTKGGLVIPSIQRDYVQGRNTKKIKYARDCLLNDLHAACVSSGKSADLNYVYGTLEGDEFTPIDGQQRLTTLWCLHLYAFAKDGKHHNEILALRDKFVYEVRPDTGRFLNGLADHIEEYFTKKEYKKIRDFIEDSGWYHLSWNRNPSVHSIKVMLDEIQDKFADIEDLSDILLDSKICPITFMQLMIDDMGKPSDQYVKMNSRGKALTDFETFKSELFNVIDDGVLGTKNFKAKIDGDWADAIWEACLKDTPNPTEEDVGRCDDLYMRTLHYIIINRLYDKYKPEDFKDLQAGSFYNFANYAKYIKDESGYVNGGIVLKDIYSTLSLVKFLQHYDNAIFRNLSFFSDTQAQRLRINLFAFIKYATELPESEWTVRGFASWNRIMGNLTAGIDRNDDSYLTERNRIAKLPIDCLRDAYAYFASNESSIKSIWNFGYQAEEEIVKAKLIRANGDWEIPLIEAESHKYFNHEIFFALKLLGIDDSCIKDASSDISQFKNNWKRITEIFGNMTDEWWIQMRRLLLTYDDYSYKSSDYGIDDYFKTYYYIDEYNHYNVDWRGFLRSQQKTDGKDTFLIFKEMFEDWCGSGFTDFKVFAEDRISNYVKNNASPLNDDDELRYYLVKNEKMFWYIHYSGFVWKSNATLYLLATKNRKRGINYKLYALHTEIPTSEYTEYKSDKTTDEHIKIGNHKIKYDNDKGYYLLDGATICGNAGNIRIVDEMKNYLKSNNIC